MILQKHKYSSGGAHTVLINTDGDTYAFGNNTHGQLGTGDYITKYSPTKNNLNVKIKGVNCGNRHTIFIDHDGKAYSTGFNRFGQLGLGDILNRNIPTEIVLEDKIIVAGSGQDHTILQSDIGKVFGIGSNSHGQLGSEDLNLIATTPVLMSNVNEKIVGVYCGDHHTILLGESGKVYGCGNNSHGQLGSNNIGKNVTKPVLISEKIIDADGGQNYTLLLNNNGKVYSLGENHRGQLGLGDTNNRNEPTLITTIIEKIVQVSCGENHSMITSENGNVYAFGDNTLGLLGLWNSGYNMNRDLPTKIVGLDTKIISAICGNMSTLLVDENGLVYTFGANYSGQLGLNDERFRDVPTMIPFTIISKPNITNLQKGGNVYYQEYLKYKFKYLKLKN